MVKTYTLWEGNTPVANANIIAGGVLGASTTYYYKIIAIGYSGYYADTQAWMSPSSTEFSVTTDATNKDTIIWVDKTTDTTGANLAEAFVTYRTKISGDYKQTNSTGVAQNHCVDVENADNNTWYRLNVQSRTQHRTYTITTGTSVSWIAGETVTGATSGATGIVVNGPVGTSLKIYMMTGTFSASENLNGSISGLAHSIFSSITAYDGYAWKDTRGDTPSVVQPLFENGQPNIQMSGGIEADKITAQDIYANLVNIGRTDLIDPIPVYDAGDAVDSAGNDLCMGYKFKTNLYFNSGCYWHFQGGTCIMMTGCKIMSSGNGQMGEATGDTTTNGACLINNGVYAWYPNFSTGTYNFYASLITGATETITPLNSQCDKEPLFQFSGTHNYIDMVFKNTGRFYPTWTLKNSRLIMIGECMSNNNTDSEEGCTWDSMLSSYYPVAESTSNNRTINAGTYDWRMDAYYVSESTKCFHINDGDSDKSTNTIYQRPPTNVSSDFVYIRSFTLNLNIVDSSGNAIQDVKVYIEESNGNNAIFDAVHSAYTTNATPQYKTGTSITLNTTVTVGNYYRVGNEVIKIESGSNPYTILRGQLGSTANNIGGSDNKKNYLYATHNYLETDSNGDTSVLLPYSKHVSLNPPYAWTYQNPIPIGAYSITIKKEGYETYTVQYTSDAKRNMVIELKDAIPVLTSTDSQVAIKLDPSNSGINRDKVIIN